MSEIERETITVLEWSEPCVSLAAEAQEVLGYNVLRDEQRGESKHTELELALGKVGIEIMKTDQVKAYQLERLRDKTSEMFQRWLKEEAGNMFIGASWEKTEINKYREPIPEFVINKAIQIKKACPEVRIYVEHLSEHPDPFLIVATKHPEYDCLNKQELYVEVWEEPKFEGRIR